MKYTSLAILFCFVIHAKAQVIQWQICLGGTQHEYSTSVKQTTDGDYVIAGYTNSNDGDVTVNYGDTDFWVVKIDPANQITWQNSFGGTQGELATSVIQTSDGGFLITGATSSNNGHVSGNHGNSDAWVVKLDPAGNLQWQKCFGGTLNDQAMSVVQSPDGNFVFAGITYSNNGDVSGNHGGMDAWVVKIDTAGNLIWQKCLGGSSTDLVSSIENSSNGNFIIAGNSFSLDGDVGVNYGLSDMWVVLIDNAGNLIWENSFGGSQVDAARSVQQTSDGGYIVAGEAYSNDILVIGNHGASDFWVIKLNPAGNMQWQQCLGGSNSDYPRAIKQTGDQGFLVAGITSSNDGQVTGSHGLDDAWLVKLDYSGNLQWQNCIGGSALDDATSIDLTIDGNFIVAGRTASNDGDISGNHGGYDFWMALSTNRFNLISGKLFIDSNSNQLHDAGENVLTNHKVYETVTGRIGFSGQNGIYHVAVTDTGNFSVQPDPVNHYIPAPINHNVSFSAFQQTDTLNDFAIQPVGTVNDLCVQITPAGPFRSGFTATYIISYQNVGNTSIDSCSLIFFPHANLMYSSASSVPDLITPDSVVWNLYTLNPFESGSVFVTVQVFAGLPIGTLINSFAKIEPVSGDANPQCNIDSWELLTVGSYDPNDILVNRDTLLVTELSNPPFLEYVIRFQNTGNDTAFFVKVMNRIDTLKLQLNTLEFMTSSHPVDMRFIYDVRTLEFRFNNILLPDSNINEPASHGFIRYRIKPITSLNAGDSILNSAAIYFDFNEPVITNTAVTQIALPTGVESLVFDKPERIKLYPNPAQGELVISSEAFRDNDWAVRIYDILGQLVLEKSKLIFGSDHATAIDIGKLNSGVYFIKLESYSGTLLGRFIKM